MKKESEIFEKASIILKYTTSYNNFKDSFLSEWSENVEVYNIKIIKIKFLKFAVLRVLRQP